MARYDDSPELTAKAERLVADLEVAAPTGFAFIRGRSPHAHVVMVVREENPRLVLTAYNLARDDLSQQVAEDICTSHAAYLCPLCFDLTSADGEEA